MFRKILNTLLTRVVSAAVSFIVAIVISQYMGPEGKGEQSLIITTIAIIMLGANLLAGPALVYLAPRHPLRSLAVPALLWSILSGGIALIFLQFFHFIDRSLLDDVAILAVLCAFAGTMVNFLIGRERIPSANLSSLLQPLVLLGYLGLRLLLAGQLTIHDYISALYLAYGISAVSASLLLLPEWTRTNEVAASGTPEVLRQMWHYGFMNQMAHVFQLLSFRMGYYFLEQLNGVASVGLYSNAVAVMESVWLLSKSIALVQYARIANSDDEEYKQRLTLELSRGTLVVTLAAVIVLSVLPSAFWEFVFGPEFSGLPRLMWILAPGTIMYTVSLLTGHYFSGNGLYHLNTFASLAGMVAALLFSVLLIPSYGPVGAAAAASISYIVTAVWAFSYFRRRSGNGWGKLIANRTDVIRVLKLFRDIRS